MNVSTVEVPRYTDERVDEMALDEGEKSTPSWAVLAAAFYALFIAVGSFVIVQLNNRLNIVEQNERAQVQRLTAVETQISVIASRSAIIEDKIDKLRDEIMKLQGRR